MEFLGRLRTWAENVSHYLASHTGREKGLNPRPVAKSLEQFSPILAMFVFEPERGGDDDRQPSLSGEDYAKLLAEHVRLLQVQKYGFDSLKNVVFSFPLWKTRLRKPNEVQLFLQPKQEHRAEIAKVVPAGERADKLNTVAEMALAFGLEHCQQLCEDCAGAVETVEAMLRQQVIIYIYIPHR
jgi:hypothetical protein